jgi:solute carrier family 66, member 2
MLVVWAVGAAVTYIMLPVNWFMETIGFLAVFTEAMLGELIIFPSLSLLF